jgi:thiamine-monophosphate kinase
MTVSELGERRLLARIRERLGTVTPGGAPAPGDVAATHPAALVIGVGDDAAVVAPSRNALTVLTTDAQIEGVHFDRRWSGPADIGYRALAVNLSDLAAMGATPRWALLSLGLPAALPVAEVEALVDGLIGLARTHGVVVVGGNLTRSPGPLIVDITAVGEVRPRRALTRSGGRPGDELFVSGEIGGAAAGLEMLRAGWRESGVGDRVADAPATGDEPPATSDERLPTSGTRAACIARFLRPQPRVRLGMAVAQARAARAAMDLSDGLADALRQVAEASGCGVEVDAGALPIDAAAREWWLSAGRDPVGAALSGGDDYELLLAVPRAWRGRLRHARRHVAEPILTRIGVLTKDRDARVLLQNSRRETLPGGFEHWR